MILAILIATAISLIGMERLSRWRFQVSSFFRAFFITDVFYLLTGFVAGGSLVASYIVFSSELIGETFDLPRWTVLGLPLWVSVGLALVSLDAGNYAVHYLLHRFPRLWAFHKVHHSSRTLDWLATFRSHIVEQIIRRLLAPVLLILLGFPIEAVTIAGGILICWVMFTHSNLRLNLSFLEPVFITPRLHRIHHLHRLSGNNLGSIFSFWDRWRGTLVIFETSEETQIGNGEPDYPQSWLPQFIEPFRRSNN